MSKTIENLKSGNYEVVDNQGISVTKHFTECLEKEFSDIEAKLAESEKSNEYFADRVEKADKEIKEIYKKYNKLVEEYNNLKEVDNNFVDGQKYNKLKHQLAEKDDELNNLSQMCLICNKDQENERLKQQLAEKEAEIKQLNNRILFSQLQAPEEQRLKIIGSSCCQYNPKRDKISFAVEKLEEMKEFFLEEHRDEEMDTDYIITKDAGEIADYLLDQIKQLKGEK